MQRRILTQTWDWKLDAFPEDGDQFELHTALAPAQSVVHIKYLDTAGVVQTVDPATYELDAVNLPGYIVLAQGASWPTDVASGVNVVSVRVTAGTWSSAADVEDDVWQWIVSHVGSAIKAPDGVLVGVSVSEMPNRYIDGLIDKYKIWSL